MAFNKHEDGYAAVWKGKTEKAPATAVGEECALLVVCLFCLACGFKRKVKLQKKDFKRDFSKTREDPT